MKLNNWVKTGIIYLILTNLAYAVPAVLQPIPSAVDPGVVQKRLQGPLTPTPQAQQAASIEGLEEKKSAVSAEAEKIKFKLTKVVFEGNTVYSNKELEKIFHSSLNQTISLAKLQNLVGQVTKKYRTDGYILSRAILPPQTIQGGVVKIQIIEGYISQVNFTGNTRGIKNLLNKYGEHIKQSRPLKIQVLERDMLLMNSLPGMSFKAVITPSRTIPGSAELSLVTENQPVNFYATYDNYGTRFLGPQQTTMGISFNSWLTEGDTNSFRFVTTAQTTQLQFYEYLHSQPIGINGTRWTIGGNYSHTHPGFTLTPIDIYGSSGFGFTDISYPVVRTRSKNVYVHSSFNYQNVYSTILGVPFYADYTRSLIFGGSFDIADRWQGINSGSLDFEQGMKIWGANKHVNQSRPEGVPTFSKFTLNLSRLQGLSSRFSLYLAMQGQYSCNPLLASEQYAYGGPEYGRGYDPSEIIGDDGLAGKAELRFQTAPEFRFLQAVQYYAFYDAGEIWNRDQTSLPAHQSATSTGLGARIAFIPQLSGNVYIAKPLTYPVATQQLLGEDGDNVRVFFQILATL